MSKKVTEDEGYSELVALVQELIETTQSLRADLWMLARLFDKKNGTVTRADVQQALEERRKRLQGK